MDRKRNSQEYPLYYYEPYDWNNGEIITEDKLDHIEDGISNISNAFDLFLQEMDTYSPRTLTLSCVTLQNDGQTVFLTLDKTWEEIYYFLGARGTFCVLKQQIEDGSLPFYHITYLTDVFVDYSKNPSEYTIQFSDGRSFTCLRQDQYPVYTNNEFA